MLNSMIPCPPLFLFVALTLLEPSLSHSGTVSELFKLKGTCYSRILLQTPKLLFQKILLALH